jgi:ABC-type nitrate/sulfonate/bicarbonate transport system substrate-binding protein
VEKLRLGLEWFLNPDHVPLLVAQEMGWFETLNIDLELVEPERHFDAMEEIEAGRMEVAITEPIHLVQDRAKGEPIVGFARFLHTNGGVMFLEESGIRRPRDMAGKRIQYPGAPGPGGPAIVQTMIEADGGRCDPADFTPVNNGFQHTDALLEDKADVATLIFYNFEVLEARGRGAQPGYFALKDWGVPDFCQLILVTSEEVLFERRSLLQRVVHVFRRGIDFLHERPEEALEIYDRRTGAYSGSDFGARIFEATVPCFTHDLSMSHDYYARLGQWLQDTGQVAPGLDRFAYWTNELVI